MFNCKKLQLILQIYNSLKILYYNFSNILIKEINDKKTCIDFFVELKMIENYHEMEVTFLKSSLMIPQSSSVHGGMLLLLKKSIKNS